MAASAGAQAHPGDIVDTCRHSGARVPGSYDSAKLIVEQYMDALPPGAHGLVGDAGRVGVFVCTWDISLAPRFIPYWSPGAGECC